MLFLHNIVNSIWAIEPSFAANYFPIVDAYLRGKKLNFESQKENAELNHIAIAQNNAYSISEYGSAVSPEDAPVNSIAIIQINGAITKHDQFCGPAGMITKSDILNRCYANDNIKAIVLSISSGGGDGYAMMMLMETIAKRNKPVGAFIDDYALSAAAGIASAADIVVANSELAQAGSFGAYITIADFRKYYKKAGINLIDVYASASTDKNSIYIQAINGNPEPLRKTLDFFNENFLSKVEKNREGKLTAGRDIWGTGKVWYAEEAKQLGIIDGIDSLENFINYFNT